MKTKQITARSLNKFIQAAMALTFAVSSQLAGNLAHAGAGWGDQTDISGAPIKNKTWYANSPAGMRPNTSPQGGPDIDTGMPIRKFVDTLPTVTVLSTLPALSPSANAGQNNNGVYLPLGFPAKWINMNGEPTADDYYELAAVEYEEKMHSDLPTGVPDVQNTIKKGTRLRGYVQIEPLPDPNYPNYIQTTAPLCSSGQTIGGGATALMGLNVFCSKHIPLKYLNGDPIKDQYGRQVYGMDDPHYVGPIVVAIKGVPVRAKFHNFLPCGANNRFAAPAGGDSELFIPVDRTITGAGDTWGGNSNFLTPGIPDVMTDNRTAVHWHGGDSPWISDGTPHQWFAPACDKSYTQGLGKGASAQDVPDMPPSGDGAYTMYWPVDLSARLMWFHEHVSGLTRLNAYVVMAAGMVVLDPSELCLMGTAGVGVPLPALAGAGVPNACALAGVFAGAIPGLPGFDATTLKYRNYQKLIDPAADIRIPFEQIPLVVQDKTIVPKDADPWQMGANFDPVAWENMSQDSKWNTDVNGNRVDKWGRYGDLWFAHVYETNQDPNSFDGTNPSGRWDWAPWFWPVFPAQYALPSGHWGDVTTTPESFMDMSLVNGTFYPTLTVDPKAYRFRVLSAGNDRILNMNFFQAVDKNNMVCDENAPAGSANATASPVPPDIMSLNGVPYPGALPPATCTEVRMVPSAVPMDPAALAKWPARWPADGRDGGVPDPSTAGPDIVVIGTEAGFIPHPTAIPAQPMVYEVNRRSVTVLNMINHGLLLGPGERADIIVDFSQFAGQTLILYNDAPAPTPAFDARIDYYTGDVDYSGAGGWFTTQAGYGPNTRTIMQVKVRNTTPAAEWLPSAAAFEDPGASNPTPSGGVPLDTLSSKLKTPDTWRTDPANPYKLTQAEWDRRQIAFAKFDKVMAAAYGLEQEPPLIPEEEYNTAFETNDGTNYARIFTGSGAQPFYNYTPTMAGQSVTAINLTGMGTGYHQPPMVTFVGATSANPATAVAVADNTYGYGSTPANSVKVATALVVGSSYVIDTVGTTNFKLCGATGNVRGEVFTVTVPCTGTGKAGPILTATAMETGISYMIDSVCTAPAGSTPAAAATFCKPPVVAVAAVPAGPGGVPPAVAAVVAVPNPNVTDFSLCGGAVGRNSPGETFVATPAATLAVGATRTNPCIGTGTVHHVPTYKLLSVSLTNGGSGYTSAPQVRFDPAPGDSGMGAQADVLMTATKKLVVHNVAIQELFEPFYGRMNATLALELPFTTVNIATTIPMNYVDPQTEEISSDEVQIWKITHNGVDTHPVHFHMVDVQILNRIGWDGTVKSISPHEYGWKETVLMHPLEDILVAMRPKLIQAPFSVPQSVRRFDPTLPLGSTLSFTNGYQIYKANGTAVTANAVSNYDNEYVWHCHILGHEENDFMRPFVLHSVPQDPAAIPAFNAAVQAAATQNLNAQLGNVPASFPTMPANLVRPVPEAPQNLTINPGALANSVTLTWNDTTPPAVCMLPGGCPHPAVISLFQNDGTGIATSTVTAFPTAPPSNWNNMPTKGHIQNENNFRVQKAPAGSAVFADVFTARANVTSWTDTAWVNGDQYRVIANNCVLTNGPAGGVGGYGTNSGVPFGAGAVNANGINGYTPCTPMVYVNPAVVGDVMSSTMNYNNQSPVPAAGFYYGDSVPSNVASATITATLLAPTNPVTAIAVVNANTAPLPNDVQVSLSWMDNSTTETSYKVEVSTHGMAGPFTLLGTVLGTAGTGVMTTAAMTPVMPVIKPGKLYTYRVTALQAVPALSSLPLIMTADMRPVAAPLAPTNMATFITSPTTVQVNWMDNANNEVGYMIEHSVKGGAYTVLANNLPPNTTTYPANEVAGSNVVYRVSAYINNLYGMAPSYSAALISGTVSVSAPAKPTNLTVATASTNSQVDLSWDDNAGNEDAYLIEFSTNSGVNWSAPIRLAMTPVHVGRVSYTHTPVTAGLIYQYRVSAVNGAGSSLPSNIAEIKLLPPLAPSAMTAVAPAIVGAPAGTQGVASLSWTDNSNNETAFEIVVSSDGVSYAPLATVTRSQTDTIAVGGRVGYNTNVVAGTNYYFQVRAINVFGKSTGFGATEVGLPFPPAAPTGMVMSIISPTQVMTTWKDNANDETSYMIENSSDGATWTTLSDWPRTNAESVSVGGLVAYVANVTVNSHIFRVSAVKTNIYGSSLSTPLLSIIPPKAPTAIGTFVLNPKAVYVSWTDNSDNETGFKVEVSTDGGKKFTRMPDVISTAQQSAAVGVNPYAIVPVTPGSNNIFRVSSFRDEGPLGLAYSAPVTSFNVAVPRK